MTRSARRAKRQLKKQQTAAALHLHLIRLSRPHLTKTEERLKKYHNDLETGLRKYGSPKDHISNLLDYIEELEDPIITDKQNAT